MGARILTRRPNPLFESGPGAADISDVRRAGRQKGQQFFNETGMAAATMAPYMFDKFFEIWWQHEAPYITELPKHTARKYWLEGFTGREPNITDRALRYRANADPPAGPKVCAYCGSRQNVGVHHKDGDESNNSQANKAWACKSCNTAIGIEHARRGIGRRTRQYNPTTPAEEVSVRDINLALKDRVPVWWIRAAGHRQTPTAAGRYQVKRVFRNQSHGWLYIEARGLDGYWPAGEGDQIEIGGEANPGATTVQQWATAVASRHGSGAMDYEEAGKLIHETPPARRTRFQKQLWSTRKRIYGPSGRATSTDSEVPF